MLWCRRSKVAFCDLYGRHEILQYLWVLSLLHFSNHVVLDALKNKSGLLKLSHTFPQSVQDCKSHSSAETCDQVNFPSPSCSALPPSKKRIIGEFLVGFSLWQKKKWQQYAVKWVHTDSSLGWAVFRAILPVEHTEVLSVMMVVKTPTYDKLQNTESDSIIFRSSNLQNINDDETLKPNFYGLWTVVRVEKYLLLWWKACLRSPSCECLRNTIRNVHILLIPDWQDRNFHFWTVFSYSV